MVLAGQMSPRLVTEIWNLSRKALFLQIGNHGYARAIPNFGVVLVAMSAPLESTKFYILVALAEGPQHGAEIRGVIIGDAMGVYLRDSTLYAALASMVRVGLVERDEHKVYRLTDKGRRILELETRTLQQAVELCQKRLGWR
jgi:DNA-binding PadR family transcriptional regulator